MKERKKNAWVGIELALWMDGQMNGWTNNWQLLFESLELKKSFTIFFSLEKLDYSSPFLC